jgi:predicted phage terminase large subunit-like protein
MPSASLPTVARERTEIRPQPGPQERALACSADILIFGGAAGGGKTWTLLLECTRNLTQKTFGAVIFRRTYPEIVNKGGLWDESRKLYPKLPHVTARSLGEDKWVFQKTGWSRHEDTTIDFSHLQYDKDCEKFTGSQIPLICFDQLELFTEYQFWYMLSRNRSLCGVPPYIRATCNPVPADDAVGGWLRKLIGWWIDNETGLPIQERDSVVRWFVRDNEELVWGTKDELAARFDPTLYPPKSLTFIAARLEDNQILMKEDPGYLANLMAMPRVERERLHGGNWNVRPTAGKVFNRAWFGIIETLPADAIRWIRYWDKAGTEDEGAYTAGVKLGWWAAGKKWIVGHVVRGQWSAHNRERQIKQTAQLDGLEVDVWEEQEPGSGGKESAMATIVNLAGFNVHADKVTGDKYTRAKPLSAQVEAGNVLVLNAEWTEAYLSEMHAFDPDTSGYKDQVDASSGAFAKLAYQQPFALINTEPTQAEVDALIQEKVTAFQDRLQRERCVFPGE